MGEFDEDEMEMSGLEIWLREDVSSFYFVTVAFVLGFDTAAVLYPAPPFPDGITGIQVESRWLVGIGRNPGGFPPHSE